MNQSIPMGAVPQIGAWLSPDHVLLDTNDAGLALRASRCTHCQEVVFPASLLCPFCLSEAVEPCPVAGSATLYSFTKVHTAPKMWQTPYEIGYADFPIGVRLMAKMDSTDSTKSPWSADQTVRLVITKSGEDELPDGREAYRYHFERE